MFLKLLLLEFILVMTAGLCFLWGTKGVLTAFVILTALNFFYHLSDLSLVWPWEMVIALYTILGAGLNHYFNKKTDHLRLIKVTAGSTVSLLSGVLFAPLVPVFFLWTVLIGLPLFFTYRKIPAAFFLQLIFKFIFSTGWIIIGNILY